MWMREGWEASGGLISHKVEIALAVASQCEPQHTSRVYSHLLFSCGVGAGTLSPTRPTARNNGDCFFVLRRTQVALSCHHGC